MSSLRLENFRFGLDARRDSLSAPAGTLVTLSNAFINSGAAVEKRRAFKRISGTNVWNGSVSNANYVTQAFGLEMTDEGLQFYVAGKTTALGSATQRIANTAFCFKVLTHPAITYGASFDVAKHALSKVRSTAYSGKSYVVAQFVDGQICCYYDGALVLSSVAGRVITGMRTTLAQTLILRDLLVQELQSTGGYNVGGIFNWRASGPTTATGYQAWVSGQAYAVGDHVAYGTLLYACTVANSDTTTPAVNTAKWTNVLFHYFTALTTPVGVPSTFRTSTSTPYVQAKVWSFAGSDGSPATGGFVDFYFTSLAAGDSLLLEVMEGGSAVVTVLPTTIVPSSLPFGTLTNANIVLWLLQLINSNAYGASSKTSPVGVKAEELATVSFTEPSAYNAGTTYAAGATVVSASNIYVSLQNSNTGNTPASSPTWWQLRGPTAPTGTYYGLRLRLASTLINSNTLRLTYTSSGTIVGSNAITLGGTSITPLGTILANREEVPATIEAAEFSNFGSSLLMSTKPVTFNFVPGTSLTTPTAVNVTRIDAPTATTIETKLTLNATKTSATVVFSSTVPALSKRAGTFVITFTDGTYSQSVRVNVVLLNRGPKYLWTSDLQIVKNKNFYDPKTKQPYEVVQIV